MKQGDIIVLEFPFSNMAEKKQRPAVVLSNSRYNAHANVLVAGIYGRKQPLSVRITNRDLKRKRLRKELYVSVQNMLSVEKMFARGVIDALAQRKLNAVLAAARKCL